MTILEEAQALVIGASKRDYGDPHANFGRIAALWSEVIGQQITSQQVAMCMILLKVARNIETPKRDNLVDIAGYAFCLDMLRSD